MEEQAKISERQAAMMEMQNKIAVYDKKLEIYEKLIFLLEAYVCAVSDDNDCGSEIFYMKNKITNYVLVDECITIENPERLCYNKLIKNCEKARDAVFLFEEPLSSEISKVSVSFNAFFDAIFANNSAPFPLDMEIIKHFYFNTLPQLKQQLNLKY